MLCFLGALRSLFLKDSKFFLRFLGALDSVIFFGYNMEKFINILVMESKKILKG